MAILLRSPSCSVSHESGVYAGPFKDWVVESLIAERWSDGLLTGGGLLLGSGVGVLGCSDS